MKRFRFYLFLYLMTISFALTSCDEQLDNAINDVIKTTELPSVSDVSLLDRGTDMVKISAKVDDNSDFPIIEKGYYLSCDKDMSNPKIFILDDMETTLNNLKPRTSYYICAFAKNKIGESLSKPFLLETKSLKGEWAYAFTTNAKGIVVAASDGKNLYFGLGSNGGTTFNDWNCYNVKDQTITPLKQFPGLVEPSLNDNNAFYIDNKIYVTCCDNTFWAYDINNDMWIQKSNTTGLRHHHVALAANGKGYYGLGEFYMSDLWEYNHKEDCWTELPASPFRWFSRNAVFSIGDDIYFLSRFNDQNRGFHKYNTKTKQWSKLTDFPGIAIQDTYGFTIGSRGYIVVGTYDNGGDPAYSSELWEYTPLYDEWEQKADYPQKVIAVGGCGVGEKAYIGCGFTWGMTGYPLSDFYVFDPDK